LRDQLVVFQALAKGRGSVYGGRGRGKEGRVGEGGLVQPSLHAKTAQWVVGEMLGVEFDGEGGCEGVGFVVGEGFGSTGELDDELDEARLVHGLRKLDVSTVE
jgi:RNA 3'-terminal phosphate cyclase (ATP)